MNVFITGGAGFIGSAIAKYHSQKGDKVWVLDNLSTGRFENLSFSIDRFDQSDLQNYGALKEAFSWADWVYHMAASVGQTEVLKDPKKAFLNNLQSTEKLFENARDHNQILFASSASIYWDGIVDGTFLREDAILKLKSNDVLSQAYRMSKLFGEKLAQFSQKQVVIARLFNIYGPHQQSTYGSVIPRFIEQCLKNKPLTIYGSGQQRRNFCYITDAVEAMEALLLKNTKRGEIYNIGGEKTVSIIELSKIVREVIGKDPGAVHIPYEQAYGMEFEEAQNIEPSFEKLHSIIGFRPFISLKDGIAIGLSY